MNEHEAGECSMSIRRDLLFTIETRLFTPKKTCLCRCIFIPPCYVVAGSKSGALYRWTIPEKIEETTIPQTWQTNGHLGTISVLHWSDSLKLLFTGSADRSVLIWQINTRIPPEEPIQAIRCFESTPICICSYMNFLFVCETRGITVLMKQNLTGAKHGQFVFRKVEFITNRNAAKNNFNTICFSPNPAVDNSGYLYAGFDNGTLQQYDAQLTEKPSFNASSPTKKICDNAIFKITFVPKENAIVVFSYDRQIRIFSPRNYRVVGTLRNPRNEDFVDACYDEEKMQYLLSDLSGFLYLWEVEDTSRIVFQTQFNSQCMQLVPVPGMNGKVLFLQREAVAMIEVSRGTVSTSYQVHSGTVMYINGANSNNAQMQLVTASDDKLIRFWDPTDFSLRDEQQIPTDLPMLSVYVGSRARPIANLIWAVTGHDEGKMFYYNVSDHKYCELPSKHKNSISSIIVVESEMKVVLLSCDYDGVCSIWSIDSILENMGYAGVSLIKSWRASDREILTSAGQWITDQPVFATGGNDKVVRLWREVDQVFVDTPLQGHTDSVTALVFEGFFLISGSEDLTIRIWDTVNMVQLSIIQNLHEFAIRAISLIDGESRFASCDAGGLVVVYDYVKKKEVWRLQHSADCKCIFVDPAAGRLYACVKSELIPHDLPEDTCSSRLPALVSGGSLSSRC